MHGISVVSSFPACSQHPRCRSAAVHLVLVFLLALRHDMFCSSSQALSLSRKSSSFFGGGGGAGTPFLSTATSATGAPRAGVVQAARPVPLFLQDEASRTTSKATSSSDGPASLAAAAEATPPAQETMGEKKKYRSPAQDVRGGGRGRVEQAEGEGDEGGPNPNRASNGDHKQYSNLRRKRTTSTTSKTRFSADDYRFYDLLQYLQYDGEPELKQDIACPICYTSKLAENSRPAAVEPQGGEDGQLEHQAGRKTHDAAGRPGAGTSTARQGEPEREVEEQGNIRSLFHSLLSDHSGEAEGDQNSMHIQNKSQRPLHLHALENDKEDPDRRIFVHFCGHFVCDECHASGAKSEFARIGCAQCRQGNPEDSDLLPMHRAGYEDIELEDVSFSAVLNNAEASPDISAARIRIQGPPTSAELHEDPAQEAPAPMLHHFQDRPDPQQSRLGAEAETRLHCPRWRARKPVSIAEIDSWLSKSFPAEENDEIESGGGSFPGPDEDPGASTIFTTSTTSTGITSAPTNSLSHSGGHENQNLPFHIQIIKRRKRRWQRIVERIEKSKRKARKAMEDQADDKVYISNQMVKPSEQRAAAQSSGLFYRRMSMVDRVIDQGALETVKWILGILVANAKRVLADEQRVTQRTRRGAGVGASAGAAASSTSSNSVLHGVSVPGNIYSPAPPSTPAASVAPSQLHLPGEAGVPIIPGAAQQYHYNIFSGPSYYNGFPHNSWYQDLLIADQSAQHNEQMLETVQLLTGAGSQQGVVNPQDHALSNTAGVAPPHQMQIGPTAKAKPQAKATATAAPSTSTATGVPPPARPSSAAKQPRGVEQLRRVGEKPSC